MTDSDSPFAGFGQLETQIGQDAYQANVDHSKAQTALAMAQVEHLQTVAGQRRVFTGAMIMLAWMLVPPYLIFLAWFGHEVFFGG